VARADADIGAPFGADRLIASMDAAALPPDAAQRARDALRVSPADGRAYRVLAQVAETEGKPAEAQRLYAIAVKRWPRERLAQAKLAEAAFAEGRPAEGLVHLDALLRVDPEARTPVLTALMPAMAEPVFRAALVERLQFDPPWRANVARALLAESTPPGTALAVLAELSAAGALTGDEVQAQVELLDRQGHPAQARAAWLASLTPEQREGSGLLFDGGFEHPAVSGGYGWRYRAPPGTAMAIERRDALEGEGAMSVVFNGRAVRFDDLAQFLALPGGRYRLQASADNEVDTTRPFLWRVTCAGDGGRLLLELALSEGKGWQTVDGEFEVPATGCPRQSLRLRHATRSLAERQVRGVLRLDGMAVTKLM
jgi:hypothetical protein